MSPAVTAPEPQNALYDGDSLDMLRKVEPKSVDLVDLVPPFNEII